MTGTVARAQVLLLRVPGGRSVTARTLLGLASLVRALVTAAVLSTLAAAVVASEPSPLLVGALGVLLCAFALTGSASAVLPVSAVYGPVVAARDHHRALARRAVPRLRDPDAPGRTRSRAPSALLPAAP